MAGVFDIVIYVFILLVLNSADRQLYIKITSNERGIDPDFAMPTKSKSVDSMK